MTKSEVAALLAKRCRRRETANTKCTKPVIISMVPTLILNALGNLYDQKTLLNDLAQALNYAGIDIFKDFPGLRTYYQGLTVHRGFQGDHPHLFFLQRLRRADYRARSEPPPQREAAVSGANFAGGWRRTGRQRDPQRPRQRCSGPFMRRCRRIGLFTWGSC
jgi:hypothetical protein